MLAAHPHAQIAWATSQSEAGGSIRLPGTGSVPIPLLQAEEAPLKECDVVISCLPHGESATWMERVRRRGVAAIDLSADLRVPGVDSPAWATGAVYGLPELHQRPHPWGGAGREPRLLSHRRTARPCAGAAAGMGEPARHHQPQRPG